MGRGRRKTFASAWLIAWLTVAQVVPLPAIVAEAAEPAIADPIEHHPEAPGSAALPSATGSGQTPGEPQRLPPPDRAAEQQDLAALLAEYASQQDSGRVDLAWIANPTSANRAEELPAQERELIGDGPNESGQRGNQARGRGNRLDPDLVRRGQNFFESACTACHDAERATSKRKSLAGWLATVRRMAAQDDADIPANQHTAIATYLASLNPIYQVAEEGEEQDGEPADAPDGAAAILAEAEAEVPPFTLNGTLSPVWRGTDPAVENKGFFPDVWVGLQWRQPSNPVSGKVTACTSCHGVNTGLGVELVEAAAVLDLCHLLTDKSPAERPHSRTQAEVTMGRFIVPFGAFSGRVHPGALRTVSLPLMFNMGRRVGPLGPGQPVLNLPYSDEGANLRLEYDLHCDWDVSLDTYAVNGLQFGGPGEFLFSRSYRDNNSNLAVGGRGTIGNQRLRFGGSLAGGELQNEGDLRQTYSLAGGDVTYRHGEFCRAYYEYAIRQEDSLPVPDSETITYGNLVEAEVLLLKEPKISFLARYDTLEHRGFFGDMSTERFTYGLNWVLPGGSLLIVNHEHWIFDSRPPVNIAGVRWTVAF